MAIGSSFTVDDFTAWVDEASIQIKAVTGNPGDPVDLGTDQVREIVIGLMRLLHEADGPEGLGEVAAELTRLLGGVRPG
ncbi:MAG: hypothetical protein K1X89_01270 [Myxococcaceae bacterium]|nr:hypothetical protein [Myxococcaceae bacterium]